MAGVFLPRRPCDDGLIMAVAHTEDATAGALNGAARARLLPDGRGLWFYVMIFNWRVCVGLPEDEIGYDDGWCYQDPLLAEAAYETWDGQGDPPGWLGQTPG